MAIRVNGEVIPEAAVRFELDRLVKFYSQHMSPARIREQMDTLRRRAAKQAVGAKLLLAEAARLDIRVPADAVRERLDRMTHNAGGAEALNALLRKQNMTRETLARSIETGLKVDQLIDRITGEAPDPSEAEVKAHFQAHAAEYEQGEQVQIQHILVHPASNEEADRAAARSRLVEIRHRIRDGADFADMAVAYSDCPSGRKAGGSLGWCSRGMMIPEMERAAFALATSELSDVVESPLGFHLIRRSGYRPAGPAVYADVREKVRDFLRHARRGALLADYVDELQKKAVIEGLDEDRARANDPE